MIFLPLDRCVDPKGERRSFFGIVRDFEISENNTKRRPTGTHQWDGARLDEALGVQRKRV